MNNIRYLGLKELDNFEINVIKDLAEKFYPKVDRDFKEAILTIDTKKYEVEGKRGKYSIHLKIDHPSIHNNILAAKQFDWDLATALHKTFDNLLNEIKHKFKKEVVQRRKKKFF